MNTAAPPHTAQVNGRFQHSPRSLEMTCFGGMSLDAGRIPRWCPCDGNGAPIRAQAASIEALPIGCHPEQSEGSPVEFSTIRVCSSHHNADVNGRSFGSLRSLRMTSIGPLSLEAGRAPGRCRVDGNDTSYRAQAVSNEALSTLCHPEA